MMHAKLRTNTKTTSEICWEKSCNWVSMRLHSITNTRLIVGIWSRFNIFVPTDMVIWHV